MTYLEQLESAGHVLKLNEDGLIDTWVMDLGYHNGPGCINCHDSWCVHCEDKIESCIGAEEYERQAKQRRYEQWLKLNEEFGENGT